MKILRKIDDSYRILIPQEIRQLFNLTKQQEVELTVDEVNNKIILTPIEKRPVSDENEIQSVQKLEQRLPFNYKTIPSLVHSSNKDKDLNSDEDISEPELEENEDLGEENIPIKIEDNKLIYGNARLPIKPVTENTRIIDEPKIDKFKSDDVLQFFTPTPISNLNDEDLTNLEFCPKCDKVVEPTSYIRVNGKKICMSCIQDLKDQLKQDIKNK